MTCTGPIVVSLPSFVVINCKSTYRRPSLKTKGLQTSQEFPAFLWRLTADHDVFTQPRPLENKKITFTMCFLEA
jgi:hypothetical protein